MEKKERHLSWAVTVIILALLFGLCAGNAGYLVFHFISLNVVSPLAKHILVSVGKGFSTIIMYTVAIIVAKKSLPHTLNFHVRKAKIRKKVWVLLPIFLLINMIMTQITVAVNNILVKNGINLGTVINTVGENGFIAAFIVSCILPAIFEELFFRGITGETFLNFGMPFSIIFTSIIFTLAHNSLINFPMIFISSVFLCIIYFYSHSIYAVIIFHFANNFTSFLMQFFNAKLEGMRGLGMIVYVMLILLISGIISAVLAVKHKLPKEIMHIIKANKEKTNVTTLLKNPVIIITIIAVFISIVSKFR